MAESHQEPDHGPPDPEIIKEPALTERAAAAEDADADVGVARADEAMAQADAALVEAGAALQEADIALAEEGDAAKEEADAAMGTAIGTPDDRETANFGPSAMAPPSAPAPALPALAPTPDPTSTPDPTPTPAPEPGPEPWPGPGPDVGAEGEPGAAIGRAAVPESSRATPPAEPPPPLDTASFEAFQPGPIPSPPLESYEALLGGLGERPFDSAPPVTPEAAWGRYLRQFGRASVWTVPVAAILFALSGMWGWPTRNAEPAGESPGTWLVVTVFGLVLGLFGVLALTALLSTTPGRRWSIGALTLVLTGSLLLAPVLGVIALARPSVTRAAGRLGPDTAADLDNRFFDNAISRWLGVGGLILLSVGWLAFGCAVLASRVLNRVDGYLVLCAVAIGVLAAYLSWQFLITVAAMVLLAAGLGLAWTASRLTPDGRTPVMS